MAGRKRVFALTLALLAVSGAARAQELCPGTTGAPAKRLAVATSANGATPYVTLSPPGASGPWLIDYGATGTSANRLDSLPASDPRWVSATHEALNLPGFDFPYADAAQTMLNLPRGISEDGVGIQQGVIGIDLLSRVVVEFDYHDPGDQHVVVSKGACPLAGKGFFLIRQAGYFGARPAAYARQGVNIPVVFTAFERADGSLAAEKIAAQFDTGMADTVWPRTVYVNDALWQVLRGQAVRVGRLNVKGCSGIADMTVWALPDMLLQITDEAGAWLTKYPAFYIVPLEPARPGSACGGIATMERPAAQIGASFLRSFGTVVIDAAAFPDGGAIWIRMPRAPQP